MHDPDVDGSWMKISQDKRLKALYQQKRTANECRDRWRAIYKDSLELGVDFSLCSRLGKNTLAFVPCGKRDRKMDKGTAFLAEHDVNTYSTFL